MATERGRLERSVSHRDGEGVRELLAQADVAAGEARAEDEGLDAALVARAQAGDVAAREEVIERLLPLVSALSRRYRTERLDPTDLVQEGVVGVLRALRRYDAGRGVPFAAYASWWIRQALQEARSDFVRPLRLPPKALRQLAQLKSEGQRIYQAEHRAASVAELAARTEIPVEQAEALVVADAREASLDEPVRGTEGEVGTLGELVEDPLSADAYEEVLDTIAGEQLRSLLVRLTERERDVVRSRFGFDGDPERLVEIGERLGVSAERVRQIEERALAKLRHGA